MVVEFKVRESKLTAASVPFSLPLKNLAYPVKLSILFPSKLISNKPVSSILLFEIFNAFKFALNKSPTALNFGILLRKSNSRLLLKLILGSLTRNLPLKAPFCKIPLVLIFVYVYLLNSIESMVPSIFVLDFSNLNELPAILPLKFK